MILIQLLYAISQASHIIECIFLVDGIMTDDLSLILSTSSLRNQLNMDMVFHNDRTSNNTIHAIIKIDSGFLIYDLIANSF